MNSLNLIGYLGQDPEIRFSQSGTMIANFSIAVHEKRQSSSPETDSDEHVNWFKVVAFDKLAEVCQNFLQKGKRVGVSGSLRQRSYESEGDKKYVIEIIARSIDLLSPQDSNTNPTTQNPF